jgi:hypothetical protein
MKVRYVFALGAIAGSVLLSPQTALAQFSQQGPKLVGAGAIGNALQGRSVSISGDGNTAIVGGNGDDSAIGAVWIWTRNGASWTQHSKLVGSGAVGNAQQGSAVSISADGNTAIVGGRSDDDAAGGAWVWARAGNIWTQQTKLVGTGAIGDAQQGNSVGLSADGNTAIVGGWTDNGQAGAAWVWARSGNVWTQGNKLVGSDAVGAALQGTSVSLSADGNTAIVGGRNDNDPEHGINLRGAAWVWTRSGSVWTQQGLKLVGSGGQFAPGQGSSVSLSADGNTAIVGGFGDNSGIGAVWAWIRNGGIWTQQGNKLVGSGFMGTAEQGGSVSLSADGNTAIVSGLTDHGSAGAVWVWTRSGGVWTQQGNKLVGSGVIGRANLGISVSLSADGKTIIAGGSGDNSNTGAAWVFTATASTVAPQRRRAVTH